MRIDRGISVRLDAEAQPHHVRRLLVEQIVHLGLGPDVEGPLRNVSAGLAGGVRRDAVCILGREEPSLRVRQVAGDVGQRVLGHGAVEGVARGLRTLEPGQHELRLVVEHLLEVRDAPALVDRVAVKAAAHVIPKPAEGHRAEGIERDVAQVRLAGPCPLAQQEGELRGSRKLWRASEAAVASIERTAELLCPHEEGVGTGHRRGGSGVVAPARQRLQPLGDHVGRGQDTRPIVLPEARELVEQVDESRPSPLRPRGKIGTAVERTEVGGEPDAHGPATLPRRRLHEGHVDAVDVGPFLAIHLDGDEVVVEHGRDVGRLERFALHHMAPVARRVADGQKDGTVELARAFKRRVAPRKPVDRVVRVLQQVGARLEGEAVRHVDRCAGYHPREGLAHAGESAYDSLASTLAAPPMPTFAELFGRPSAVTASAPGRVNLIGEHTDYNGGLMLPMPIPQRTVVELGPTGASWVRAWSANVGANGAAVPFELGAETRRGNWIDYPQGVTAALRAAGIRIGGFDMRVSSSVPVGSGLSSSAAFLVALLRGLRDAFHFDLNDAGLAQMAWRAEVDLVGVPVGIMDQMVCSLGRPDHALLIDAQSLAVTDVPIPGTCEVIVIDSNIRHRHSDGEYRTRRAECERACEQLSIPSLRSLSSADFASAAVQALPAPLAQRVRHVVTENARVGRLADALRRGDLETSGRLLTEGHASLRDDYEVSTRAIDTLVDIAAAEHGVFGARLTGGGFGGSIVALAPKGHGRAAAERVIGKYRARTGATATVVLPE